MMTMIDDLNTIPLDEEELVRMWCLGRPQCLSRTTGKDLCRSPSAVTVARMKMLDVVEDGGSQASPRVLNLQELPTDEVVCA